MFITMIRRATATLLALLILPASARAGTTHCALSQTATADSHLMSQVAGHHSPDQPSSRDQHAPCDRPASTDCCQTMVNCAVAALPSVTTDRAAAAVASVQVADISPESPIGRSLAPELPPPKA